MTLHIVIAYSDQLLTLKSTNIIKDKRMAKNTILLKFIQPGMNSNNWSEISHNVDENERKKNSRVIKEILLAAMQMQKIVVLAGSGTSLDSENKNAGPSMWDLWEACTKQNGKQYSDSATQIFELVGYDISDENEVNIEVLLSMCESYLQINTKNNKKEDVKKFVNDCKKTILENCRFIKNSDFLASHKTFIHRLSRRRNRDSRLSVFTTNYDTSFEEAASALGIVVIDGFSFASPRQYEPRFFDYDIVRRNQNKSGESDYLEGVFKLFKLHGSVNWQKDNEAHIKENNTVEAENSCMIFPARGKYQQSYIQPHLELMARYLSALREPNTCLIIIGFGFNDDHLSEPILSAIKSNPHLKVIIVNNSIQHILENTDGKCSSYWKKLDDCRENGEDIYFIEATFADFSQLIPDLIALTPEEKIIQGIKQISGEPYEA